MFTAPCAPITAICAVGQARLMSAPRVLGAMTSYAPPYASQHRPRVTDATARALAQIECYAVRVSVDVKFDAIRREDVALPMNAIDRHDGDLAASSQHRTPTPRAPLLQGLAVGHDSELVAKAIHVRAHAPAGHVVAAERLGNEALHA